MASPWFLVLLVNRAGPVVAHDQGPTLAYYPDAYASLLADPWVAEASLVGFSALHYLCDQFPTFDPPLQELAVVWGFWLDIP